MSSWRISQVRAPTKFHQCYGSLHLVVSQESHSWGKCVVSATICAPNSDSAHHKFHCSTLWSATGLGKQLAARIWTPNKGQFSSRPVQKPNPPTLGGPNPDPYPAIHRFCRVWLDPSVPISSSAFGVSHLWLHSDMLLLYGKFWHW